MDQLENIQITLGKADTPADKNVTCQRLRQSNQRGNITEFGAATDLMVSKLKRNLGWFQMQITT